MDATTIITAAYFKQMAKDMSELNIVKKIKVTSQFYHVLRSLFDREVLYGISSPPETWVGIPIEIDDTITNDYELVYKGEML